LVGQPNNDLEVPCDAEIEDDHAAQIDNKVDNITDDADKVVRKDHDGDSNDYYKNESRENIN
jgi:hypothetical protein